MSVGIALDHLLGIDSGNIVLIWVTANPAVIAQVDRLPDVVEMPRNARAEAQDLMEPGFVARVLEPSPPAVHSGEFSDDPTDRSDAPEGAKVVSPVASGDITWVELVSTRPDLKEWATDRWLGPWPRLGPVPAGLIETRESLHQLAFFVLAPARHRINTKIGLRFTGGGFGTPFYGDDEQVRIDGLDLIVQRGSRAERLPLTTVGEACRAAGTRYRTNWFPAFGDQLEPRDPDDPLLLGAKPAAAIAAWFGFATGVLEEIRGSASPSQQPSRVQLWPEHFDVAIELGDSEAGTRASFGASPGDENHPGPYLYVSAWGEIDRSLLYWNDPHFNGASLAYDDLVEVDDQRSAAFEFYRRGQETLGS